MAFSHPGSVLLIDAIRRRRAIGGDRGRRLATASPQSETLLKVAEGVLETRQRVAAELIDALLERAAALNDAERIANAAESADKVEGHARGVRPALQRADIAHGRLRVVDLTAKPVDCALALARGRDAQSGGDPRGRGASRSGGIRARRSAGVGGDRRGRALDCVPNVVDAAAVGPRRRRRRRGKDGRAQTSYDPPQRPHAPSPFQSGPDPDPLDAVASRPVCRRAATPLDRQAPLMLTTPRGRGQGRSLAAEPPWPTAHRADAAGPA